MTAVYSAWMATRSATALSTARALAAIAMSTALLMAMLVASPTGAKTAGETTIFAQHPDGPRSKPSSLFYVGYPFVLGVTYAATGLRWRNWGEAVARSSGRLKVCPNMSTCRRYRIKVAVSGLVKNAEGTGLRLYSYVSFTRIGRSRPLVKICVYGEACRLGPVP